ncbi:hypothetical protein [Photobacterium leiognathi]|uniref:hypothetical protein n=1 Tax=Photobacterium leiognathi TaxID=553611 RepID=UPI003DA0B468
MGLDEKKLSKYNNIIAIVLAVLTTLGAGLSAAWLWFDSKVELILDEQVKPYQEILIGLSMQQAGNNDEAIEYFYRALTSLQKDADNKESLIAVVDPLLISIAAVEKPHRYIVEFHKSLEIIEGEVRPTGDRHNSIAWIYWSTGDNKKAREHFNKSINYYIQDGVQGVSGNSYFGAFLTHVVDGTYLDNISLYENAWTYDYSRYNPGQIVNESFHEFDWVEPLLSIYKGFATNYIDFQKELHKQYEIEPQKYQKN